MGAAQLRDLFNAVYVPRIDDGRLKQRVVEDSHPSPERSGEPYCTWSQTVAYSDREGNTVVRAHRYLRPDGTLGASGLPDPKSILHEGWLLYV